MRDLWFSLRGGQPIKEIHHVKKIFAAFAASAGLLLYQPTLPPHTHTPLPYASSGICAVLRFSDGKCVLRACWNGDNEGNR